MTRWPFFACWLGLALPGAAQLASVESIPVDHKEPITIRVLNGANGQPIPNLRLVLLAGYTESDISHRAWREEVVTNANGEARLPQTLVNLPFLEAWLLPAGLCQSNPHGELYRIGRIRNAGWTAPNHCGVVPTENDPGVLNLFASRGPVPAVKTSPESTDPSPSPSRATLDYPVSSPAASASPVERPALPANEIQSLPEDAPLHTPAPPPPSGTTAPPDSYNDMCVPDR